MHHVATKMTIAAVGAAAIGLVTAIPANADNAIIAIGKNATRSATSKIVYVRATVTCSEDTTDAYLSGTVTQVTHGSVQSATGYVAGINAFECSGEEETVWLPVRRPTGGYKWVAGSARVSNLSFTTTDPTGSWTDTAKGRTVTVK
jgi:hypothetical protein